MPIDIQRRRRPPMSHSYCVNHIHIVFSTKERSRTIKGKQRMWKFITGIARRMKIDMISIGGMEDHGHMLLTLPADLDAAKAINTIKVNSSRWMKGTVPSFAWL